MVSDGPLHRRARGRRAEVARSSRVRIRVWISSRRSTWDGDAGLSVVDRRFGARCLPPYFSRFRPCWKQLVISISAGLGPRFPTEPATADASFPDRKLSPRINHEL